VEISEVAFLKSERLVKDLKNALSALDDFGIFERGVCGVCCWRGEYSDGVLYIRKKICFFF
jgi:hypothetical protein